MPGKKRDRHRPSQTQAHGKARPRSFPGWTRCPYTALPTVTVYQTVHSGPGALPCPAKGLYFFHVFMTGSMLSGFLSAPARAGMAAARTGACGVPGSAQYGTLPPAVFPQTDGRAALSPQKVTKGTTCRNGPAPHQENHRRRTSLPAQGRRSSDRAKRSTGAKSSRRGSVTGREGR